MTPASRPERGAWVTLTVLVYVLNFLDRQIPSILAERIKADLGATDAQMGFLYGTASAAYLLLVTLVGLALGPFAIGRLSVGLGDLRAAMCCGLVAYGVALVFLVIALRGFARDEATLRDRARAAGETGI